MFPESRPRHSQLFPSFAAVVPCAAAFSSSHVLRPLDEGAGTPVREREGVRDVRGREGVWV